LCFCGMSLGLHGQVEKKEAPATVLKLNPLSLLVATGNVQIERRLGDRFSGQFGINFGRPKLKVYAPNLLKPVQYTLFTLTPEIRYYISFQKRQVPRGPYLAAYLRFHRVGKQYEIIAYDPDQFQNVLVEAHVRTTAFGGGFLLGYQFFFKDHFGLDLFIGPKYGHANSNYEYECPNCDGDERTAEKPGISYSGLDIRAGVGIGYGF
jgi:hypothetical protein